MPSFDLRAFRVEPWQAVQAFFNAGVPFGGSALLYDSTESMSEAEARAWVAKQASFDHVKGRCLRISFEASSIDAEKHDAVYGSGSAAKILFSIRKS